MLQTACMSPELLVNQNMSESEICGYSPGQGSPLPGETASPKSCFQQSPSLPDSGLTELNVASPKIFHPPPPCQPPGMPAPADSELSSDPPQKLYMGVRVKMPVRELLRKIRLSKGLEPAPSKEASSVKTVTKGSSGKTAEKRRTHPYTEKQLRQGKQGAGQTPKGLEDLDILVEVLQEDLNESQLREEPRHPVPDAFWQGFSADLRGEEAAGGRHSSARLPPEPCWNDFHPILRGKAEPSSHGRQESSPRSGAPGMFPRTGGQGSAWWMQDALPSCQPAFLGNSASQESFPRSSASQESFPRSSAPQQSFPRSSAPQQSFPRSSAPQQSFPRSSASQESFPRSSPSQPGFPRSSPSQQSFPRSSASQQSFPRSSASQQSFPRSSALQQSFPRSSAPQQSFPRSSPSQPGFPRSSASQESFPRSSASQESFPRSSASQESFPRSSAPQQSFPRSSAPQETFPRSSAPQETFPRSSASQQSFPRSSASQPGFPRSSASQESFPRSSPSQPGFPRSSASQQSFPRSSPSQQSFPRNSPYQENFPRNSAPRESFPRNSASQDTPAAPGRAEALLAAPRGSPDVGGCLRPTPIPFPQQDLSALSFFQFQLHREENLLRNIPEDKLLAPDENGDRLLHKAVAQGRRALTFALAQRFASLNKIDEKDAEERTALHLAAEKNQHLMVSDLISLGANVNEQDSSGRTPLHLCAENGYLRVLEVLKSCKDSGVCVEVDLPDHCGLTALHRAALAHTALLAESQSSAWDGGTGRFLRLRQQQILEGILCLLQMGAKPQLQVLNPCQSSTACLQLQENAELLCLLQAYKPQAQDVPQESCSLLDAPRGIPAPPAADNLPELCSLPPPDLLDVLLTGKC